MIMRAYYSVTVKKCFENCTLDEATQLLDRFSGGDCYSPSVSVFPETGEYGEWRGTYEVIVNGNGVGGISDSDTIFHFAKQQFEDIERG